MIARATIAGVTDATGNGRTDRDDRDHGDREAYKKSSSRTSRVSGEVFAAPPTCVASFVSSNDVARAGCTIVLMDDSGD